MDLEYEMNKKYFDAELSKTKKRSLWTRAHLAFRLRTHNLVLVAKGREYAHKFQKIGHSGIVSFAYIGKKELHRYMQYEAN